MDSSTQLKDQFGVYSGGELSPDQERRAVDTAPYTPAPFVNAPVLSDLILPKLSAWRQEKTLLCISDCLALLLAFFVGHSALWLWKGQGWDFGLASWLVYPRDARFMVFATMAAIATVRFWAAGHYSRRKPFWAELQETLSILFMLAVLDAAAVFLGKWPFSRFMWFMTWSLALILVPTLRFAMKRLLIKSKGWSRPTVILGCGKNAVGTAAAFSSDALMGFEVVAFASLPYTRQTHVPESITLAGRSVPVIRADDKFIQQLIRLSHLNNLGHLKLVIALEAYEIGRYRSLLEALSRHYSDIQIIPNLPGIPVFGMEMTYWFSHDLMLFWVRNNLARAGPRLTKRIFDLVCSTILLVLLSPLFVYLMLRVRQDGGPAFHAHTRIGHRGKSFGCYKFRTMTPNAEVALKAYLAENPAARAEWARNFKLKDDPRVTTFGSVLRRTSLDELPQLWNVLKGDMSLVGPRPIVEAELARYGVFVEDYLAVKPGITGLWQISGRNDVDYERRIFLDAWYIRNWSLWHDVIILTSTIGVVLTRSGAY